MDLTSLMSALLSDNTVNSVAGKAGASAGDAVSVLAAALPSMLNGANGQASNPATAESFFQAVNDHAGRDSDKVDVIEGEKIVNHLLGSDAEDTQKAIAKKTGLSKSQVAMILAAAAPLLMKMLGNQTSSSNNANTTASMLGSLLGGGMNSSSSNSLMTQALGSVLSSSMGGGHASSNNSLLGSLLSSAVAAPAQQQASPASMLGSLLGATQQAPQASAAGNILGSLLGGGSQSSSGLGSAASILSSLLK